MEDDQFGIEQEFINYNEAGIEPAPPETNINLFCFRGDSLIKIQGVEKVALETMIKCEYTTREVEGLEKIFTHES